MLFSLLDLHDLSLLPLFVLHYKSITGQIRLGTTGTIKNDAIKVIISNRIQCLLKCNTLHLLIYELVVTLKRQRNQISECRKSCSQFCRFHSCTFKWLEPGTGFLGLSRGQLSFSQVTCLNLIFGKLSCMFFLCSKFNKDLN